MTSNDFSGQSENGNRKSEIKITDFGLAKFLDGGERTGTGALLGTPSYMAPEQAGKGAVDARTDVYALGVILYELLTGRLPFQGATVAETLELVRSAEPVSPGQLQPKLPRDLPTICLKCLQKEPARRYADAEALAEDLHRFLDGRPILARPISSVERAFKWVKRRPTVAALSALVVATVLLVAGGWTWWELDRAARRGEEKARREITAGQVRHLLDSATGLRGRGARALALAEANQARGLLERVEGLDDLRQEVLKIIVELERAERSHQLLARVEAIRQWGTVRGDRFDPAEADAELTETFREAGADVDVLPPAEIAERLDRAVWLPISGGIAFWAELRAQRQAGGAGAREHLLNVVRAVDPDPFRGQVRQILARRDPKALMELAAGADPSTLPAATFEQLGEALLQVGEAKVAVALLTRAQREHPGDYWINHHLAAAFFRLAVWDQAVRYSSVAVALRPDSSGAHVNLGNAYFMNEEMPAAVAALQRAVHLDGASASAQYNLGLAYYKQKNRPKADATLARASALDPRHANTLHYRGLVLFELHRFQEAAELYKKALTLTPGEPSLHCDLARALQRQGLFAEALVSFRRGHEIGSKSADWRSPSGLWIQEAERMAELDRDLPAVLAGKKTLSPPGWIEYAQVCYHKQMYATSVRFFQSAFEGGLDLPEAVKATQFANAAYAAVLAGSGRGEETAPNAQQRTAWRKQACGWLRTALAHWERQLSTGTPRDRAAARRMLGHWKTDYSLSTVRDSENLAGLPAEERAEWEQFWNAVQRALATKPSQNPLL